MKRSLLSIVFLFAGLITAMAAGHVATAVGTSPTCNGLCNGSAVAMASGGIGPYGFTWTGPASYTATGANISGLCAGTYVVTAIDSSDMSTALYTLNLTQPSPVTVTANSPTMCVGMSASVISNVTGGTPGYTYLWSPGAGLSSVTISNPIASPTVTTFYTVTVTDANGCTGTAISTVTVNPLPVVVANSGSTCNGNPFTIFATGAMTYIWSTGASSNPIIVNPPTTTSYTVTGTTGGCVGTAVATVTVNPSPTVSLSPTPATCGGCDGTISTSATGATTYNWTPSGSTMMNLTSLCPGTYTLTATSGMGCATSVSTTVGTPSTIVTTTSAFPSSCGMCDGGAIVSASGGTPPYTYDWIPGSPIGDGTTSISSLCAGSYTVVVTDGSGCTATGVTVVTTANTGTFSVANSIINESAFGLSDGSIDITITGSTAPYTFLWSNGATTEDIFSLVGGGYSVTIIDNLGDCSIYYFTITTPSSNGYITGYAYSDNNLNCIYDAGDNPLAGYYIFATSGTTTAVGYTNSLGFYSILTPSGSYTVTPVTNTINLEGACINSYSVSMTPGSTIANNNFSYVLPVIYDVCVSAYSTGVVPGFNGSYNVYLNNYGTQPATGVVYIVLPTITSYVSSIPLATSVSGDTVFWNYTLLPPGAMQGFNVIFYTPPTAVLGTPAIAYVNATVTNGTDVNPTCNSYVYTRIITGSFDPNAKTVSPCGQGPTGNIPLTETEFTYLIQFQNTGSGPAVNITVTDTLSSMLDLMSFEMLDASDPYVVEFLPDNLIRWKFDNIMLPDSTSDEPGSHGHILFKMSKATAPSYGEEIKNKVFIYFDFNAPVITNTAINTYSMATATEGQVNESGNITVYPNPFTDNTTFIIQSDKLNEKYSFEMTDVLGKTVKAISGITEKQFNVSREELQNGIYLYKIFSNEGIVGVGKIIIK